VTRLATFAIAGRSYGVDVARVQEVLRAQAVTPIPLAPPEVAGLINLRGEIVTALDLRVRLGAAPRRDAAAMNVIMTTEHGPVSLLVDEAGDVLDLDDATREAPPATLRGAARELIAAVYPFEDRLVMELDVARAVDEQTSPSGTDVEVEDR
jgi:purine-binding chemotaxis protein CheW